MKTKRFVVIVETDEETADLLRPLELSLNVRNSLREEANPDSQVMVKELFDKGYEINPGAES